MKASLLALLVVATPVAAAARGQAFSPAAYAEATSELDRLERRLAWREQKMASLADESLAARRQQAYAQSLRALTAMRLTKAQKQLRARLAVLGRQHSQQPSELLTSIASLGRWVEAERRLMALASHDRRLLADIERAHAAIDATSRQHGHAVKKLAALEVSARRERAQLVAERKRRQGALKTLLHAAPKDTLAAMRLRVAEAAVQVATRDSPPQATADGDRASAAGAAKAPPKNLPWPVLGPLQGSFGERVDRKFGTVTRHSGIAIGAAHGAAIQSVLPGQVVYADWLPGFGRTVIVAHPNDVHTVHAHLSKLSVKRGQSLGARATLGEVGDSASMRGTVLYFELRAHGRPVDPLHHLAPQRP